MARFFAWLGAILLLPVLVVAGLLLAALDAKPLVDRGETISPAAIAQAKRLFAANDPRRMQGGERRTVAIPAALFDEGANYLANRFLKSRGALVLAEESAEIRLSVRLPGAGYLNLRTTIHEAENEPHIAAAAIGSLPVPAALVEAAINWAVGQAGVGGEWSLARRAIRQLSFEPAAGTVTVTYVWTPEILARARAIALNPEDVARLKVAQTALAGLLDHRATGARVPLAATLKPLLLLPSHEAPAMRRAALLVLAIYLYEKDLAALVPEARQWPRPRPVALTLQGRYDSAQHFVISATLAAWAGEPVADAIGLYKELDDARHGSGFSFADLAADRAGTRFGELAVRAGERLDAALQGDFAEADLLPPLAGLPEFLGEREFRRRFGGAGSPAYREMVAEIERRVAALPLYR